MERLQVMFLKWERITFALWSATGFGAGINARICLLDCSDMFP